MIPWEGCGQRGFDEIGKLGMPCGKVQTHVLEGSGGGNDESGRWLIKAMRVS